jgi:hypothetical protein
MKTIKIMKKTSILAMLCIGLLSCNSEIESLEFEEANLTSKKSKSSESTVNQQLRNGTLSVADVVLGDAGAYTILSKSGITNVSPSRIVGDVGTSPITGAALLLTCAEVTGEAHTVAAPGPDGSCRKTESSRLTTAVGEMQAAYTDVAGRFTSTAIGTKAYLNVGAGILGGGVTLTPGVYTWGSTLLIPENITLDNNGITDPIWIFQVAGTLTMSNDVKMEIVGAGRKDAEDVFWQVSGAVTLGTGSHFIGTLLGKTSIAVQTHATVNGRLLAQTAVTLQKNIVWLGLIPPAEIAQAQADRVQADANAAATAAQASADAAQADANLAKAAEDAAQVDADTQITAQDAANDAKDAADDAQDAADDAQVDAGLAATAATSPPDATAAEGYAQDAAVHAQDAATAAQDAAAAADEAAEIKRLQDLEDLALTLVGAGSAVDLGEAGNFAILSKSGITNVSSSSILGDVGTSPITGAALLLTNPEVNGSIYTVAAAGPAGNISNATKLAAAVLDMQAAYENAAGRTLPDFENLGAGTIGVGVTLEPGLYKWGSALLIPNNITLGNPNNVLDPKWIFQVAGTLTVSNDVIMTLNPGLLAENIVWQVAGAVTLGTNSHFEGTLLGKTSIAVQTDASVKGRLLAQTAVTLQMNTVTAPN